jgi:DNA-binding CsgD family transcriptional regulator/PAS domain-containing protein
MQPIPPHDLVEKIYAALDEPEHWQDVLASLALATRAETAVLYCHRHSTPELRVPFRVDPAIWDYLADIFAEDEYHKRIATGPVGRAYTNDDLLPLEEYRHTRAYTEYARTYGYVRLAGTVVERGSEFCAVVGLHRPEQAEPFGSDHRRLLDALTPHLRRSLKLRVRLETAELRAQSLGEVFGYAPYGLLLLDWRGRVAFANPVAERLLASGDIPSQDERLVGRAPHLPGCDLTAAVDLALGRASGPRIAQACLIPRLGDALRPLAAWVCPLSGAGALARAAGSARAVVVIFDPEQRPGNEAKALLSRLYGLTRAEAAVAVAVLAGDQPAVIAAARSVGLDTVKSHLKAVFAKTGVSRQADLVRVLAPLVAAADASSRAALHEDSVLSADDDSAVTGPSSTWTVLTVPAATHSLEPCRRPERDSRPPSPFGRRAPGTGRQRRAQRRPRRPRWQLWSRPAGRALAASFWSYWSALAICSSTISGCSPASAPPSCRARRCWPTTASAAAPRATSAS